MYVIRERLFDIGDDFDITDDDGRRVLHVDGKALSPRGRLVIEDASGQEVASVHRKLVALRATYVVEIAGRDAAEVRKDLFTPFRERFTIEVGGSDELRVTGDLLDHEFTVERDGQEVARASKSWFRVRDSYGVRIADGEDHLLILASVLALELALSREAENEKGDD